MAEEYACVIDRGGKKRFTHKGVHILLRDIPHEYLDNILSRAQDKRMTIEEDDLQDMQKNMNKLEEKRKKLEEKIASLAKDIEEQKLKIEEKKLNPPPPQPKVNIKPTRKSKPVPPQPKRAPPPPPSNNPIIANLQTKEFFDSLGIKDERDWKKWLLRNHPDKNPNADIDLVGMVNNRARVYFQKS